jgi:hypothetical protein
MLVFVTEECGDIEEKIFQDKVQACGHIADIFTVFFLLNLNYS